METGPFLEIFHSYVFENQWVAEERGISWKSPGNIMGQYESLPLTGRI
jgi:hypothetical protein